MPEPHAILQRDYGFRYCVTREEVTRLRGYYAAVLARGVEPLDVHGACVRGRLGEVLAREGVLVRRGDERLLKNDWPSPWVGWEREEGTGAYRGTFFRRALR